MEKIKMPKRIQSSNLLSWAHAYCAYNALVANGADVFNHGMNVYHRLSAG